MRDKILKTFYISSFVLILSCTLLSEKKSKEEIRREAIDLVGDGIKSEREKNLTVSLEKYLKAIEISPRPIAYYRVAQCYAEMGEFDRAIQYYEKTIELSPDFKKAGLELENLKLGKKAEPTLIASSPTNPQPSISSKEKSTEVIPPKTNPSNQKQATDETTENKQIPEQSEVNKVLFPSLYGDKDGEALEKEAQSGASKRQITLTSFDYHKNKAEVYKSNGHYNGAIGEYLDALKYQPDDLYCLMEVATLYGKIGRTQKSIESFNELMNNNPQNPTVFFKAGSLYYQFGDLEKAKTFYKRAVDLNPTYIAPQNNLGVIYMKQGLYNEAIESFTKVTQIEPTYSNAYLNLGIIYEENLKDTKKAIEYYQKYVLLNGPKRDEVEKWISILKSE